MIIIKPILQISKLRHRGLSNLLKIIELICGKNSDYVALEICALS